MRWEQEAQMLMLTDKGRMSQENRNNRRDIKNVSKYESWFPIFN